MFKGETFVKPTCSWRGMALDDLFGEIGRREYIWGGIG